MVDIGIAIEGYLLIMPKTLVNLDQKDKTWLDREARKRHLPMTELVRQAVRHFREQEESLRQPSQNELLEKTSGIWR